MNIMIISDDHGRDIFKRAFDSAKALYGKIDYVIHAGDTERIDDRYYIDICDCPISIVKGNNDYNDAPAEVILKLGGKRIFVTHGHRYSVYMGIQNIAYAGMERRADIVIFGHTHHPLHQKGGDIELINPGSLAGIRSGCASYAVLQLGDEEVVNIEYL